MVSGTTTDIDSDFIRNRTIQLNFFVQQISDLPFLMTSTILHSFLSIQDEFKKKETINTIYVPPHSSSSTTTTSINNSTNGMFNNNHNNGDNGNYNDGETTWKLFLESFSLPTNNEILINDIKRQLELLKVNLKSLMDECYLLQKASIQYHKHFSNLSEKTLLWQYIENDIADKNKNEIPIKIPQLSGLLYASIQSIQYFIKANKNLTKLIMAIIMANIQFQIAQIEGN